MGGSGHQQSDVVDVLLARHPLFARVTVERWVAEAFASQRSSRDPGDAATVVLRLLDDRLRYLTQGEHLGDPAVHWTFPGPDIRMSACAPCDRQDVPARLDRLRTNRDRRPGPPAPAARSALSSTGMPSSWQVPPSRDPRSVVHRLLSVARARFHERHR